VLHRHPNLPKIGGNFWEGHLPIVYSSQTAAPIELIFGAEVTLDLLLNVLDRPASRPTNWENFGEGAFAHGAPLANGCSDRVEFW